MGLVGAEPISLRSGRLALSRRIFAFPFVPLWTNLTSLRGIVKASGRLIDPGALT